jgi:hypothetical protein
MHSEWQLQEAKVNLSKLSSALLRPELAIDDLDLSRSRDIEL